MQFLRVSRRKSRRFFPCGAFLSCVVGECLSKIPGYAPVEYGKRGRESKGGMYIDTTNHFRSLGYNSKGKAGSLNWNFDKGS